MNKKLLTLAIGAALGAAPMFAAQADVKLFGRVQAEIGQTANDGAIAVTPPANANNIGAQTDQTFMNDAVQGRWGIAVDEDLGGGLKAVGMLEWITDTAEHDTNAARNAFVGLSHKAAGTVRFGVIDGAYKATGASLDPLIGTNLEARNNYGMSGNADGYGVLNAHGSYLRNMVQYISPNWSGLTIDAAVGVDGTGGDASCGIPTTTGAVNSFTTVGCGQAASTRGDISAAVSWKGGPVNVFVAYAKMANATPSATVKAEPTAKKVGASFKFGGNINHTINAQYEMIDRDTASGTGTSSTTGFGAEATYLFLGYHLGIGSSTISLQGGVFADDVETEATYYALAYTYNFSKTAKAWVGYRFTELDNGLMTNATVNGNTVGKIRDESYYGIGLRKDF